MHINASLMTSERYAGSSSLGHQRNSSGLQPTLNQIKTTSVKANRRRLNNFSNQTSAHTSQFIDSIMHFQNTSSGLHDSSNFANIVAHNRAAT